MKIPFYIYKHINIFSIKHVGHLISRNVWSAVGNLTIIKYRSIVNSFN